MDSYQKPNSKIEKIEKKLYSKYENQKFSERSDLREKKYNLEKNWGEKVDFSNQNINTQFVNTREKRTNIFSFLLILATLFFVGALGYASYIFMSGKQSISSNQIELKALGPLSIGSGEELNFDLLIQNNNPVKLEQVELAIEYPVGTKSPDDLITDLKREKISLDDINPGSSVRHSVSAALFGEDGEKKNINFDIKYKVSGSDATFQAQKDFEIILSTSPIRLNVFGLEKMSSGQEVELKYQIEINSPNVLKNVAVQVDYPFGFTFSKSSIDPSFKNNFWVFEELKNGDKKEVTIKGFLTGQDSEKKIFKFSSGLTKDDDINQIGAVFNTKVHEIEISKPFVGFDILIQDSNQKIVNINAGQSYEGTVVFTNNTNHYIENLNIDLNFSGNAFDEKAVEVSDGYFRSLDDKIIWNYQNNEDLKRIEPRRTIELPFSVNYTKIYKDQFSVTNPEIKMDAKVSGVRIFENNVEEKLENASSKIVRVITDIGGSAKTLIKTGPIINSGPIPPKVDTPTTYTIELSLDKNTSNDIDDVVITGSIPSFIKWKNVFLPKDEKISFNEETRKFVWEIGKIRSATGFGANPVKAYFQVELLPSVSQLDQTINLFENINLSARDTFANVEINEGLNSVSTFSSTEQSVLGDKHSDVIE